MEKVTTCPTHNTCLAGKMTDRWGWKHCILVSCVWPDSYYFHNSLNRGKSEGERTRVDWELSTGNVSNWGERESHVTAINPS